MSDKPYPHGGNHITLNKTTADPSSRLQTLKNSVDIREKTINNFSGKRPDDPGRFTVEPRDSERLNQKRPRWRRRIPGM
ncbi:uncharacterized protein G2W53_018222 [Senna tora]|uniref:Uncharacterized protein n=1 Tax=Senna tora TaxID=362788 RepID=A0A834WN51_9FABA|nr:uncharacterized protein G2W53_018222 [Senna tora]